MFVRNRMTPHSVAVAPDLTLAEAYRIMQDNAFRGLPVMADGQLAGVINMGDILAHAFKAGGEPALANASVREVMVTEFVTVSEDEVIEEAAHLLRSHDSGVLPVVDDGGDLVGTITESDLFGAFIEMLGLSERGTRITMRIEDRLGMLANMTQVIKQSHASLASLATFPTEGAPACVDVVVRLKTIEPKDTVDALRRAGFRVLHVSQMWK